jgi:RNA polymerase sigma-70 factor (ECF subfamily)
MQIINLRDYYPFYTSDCFVEVHDEVADVFLEFKRHEAAYQRRTYWNKAQYSLDRGDGIENDILFVPLPPEEIYERKVTTEQLHAAISSLPDKQAKRIFAYYFLGISKAAIAREEGVNRSQVTRSIRKALLNIQKFLQKLQ